MGEQGKSSVGRTFSRNNCDGKIGYSVQGVTHLILSSGNPMGRIMSIIGRQRAADSLGGGAKEIFQYWQQVVESPEDTETRQGGDSPETTFDFSISMVENLKKLKIPVLITYGKDYSAPFNDCLRVEMIRQKKPNFTFEPCAGLEHNYMGVKQDEQLDYDNFNWDKVTIDWEKWLDTK